MPGETQKEAGKRTLVNFCTIGHVDHGKTTTMSAFTLVANERSYGDEKSKFLNYGDIDKTPEEKARGITINSTSVQILYNFFIPSEYSNKVFTSDDFDPQKDGDVFKKKFPDIGLPISERVGMTPEKFGEKFGGSWTLESINGSGTDCPGHEDYVKNAIVGASQNDGGVLILSATDGVMPQTREHVLLARQVGIKKIVVIINKCDVSNQEMIDLCELDARSLLKELNFDENSPMFFLSSLKALDEKVPVEEREKEKDKIESALRTIFLYFKPEKRNTEGDFLMYIEDVLTITGRGTVVTGKVVRGKCCLNDVVGIFGFMPNGKSLTATVTGLESYRKAQKEVSAGENVGVLLRGIERDDVRRGQVLAKPGSIVAHNKFTAQVLVLTEKDGGRSTAFLSTFQPQVFIGTATVTSNLIFPEGVKTVMPGDNLLLTFVLKQPVALEEGSTFAVREGKKTIASGKVVEVINN